MGNLKARYFYDLDTEFEIFDYIVKTRTNSKNYTVSIGN